MQSTNKYLIYTDGACKGNPGPGGWACIIVQVNEPFEKSKVTELAGHEPETTNNKMEITAVGKALRALENSKGDLKIYTDSKYVLNGASKWAKSWRDQGWKKSDGTEVASQAYWKRILELLEARDDKVEFEYVPGHAGIPGNDRCDELAVECSNSNEPDLFDGIYEEYIDLLGIDLKSDPQKMIDTNEKSFATGPWYLSYVDSILERHKTWSECEARVKGRTGSKFKKVKSISEEKQILKAWNIN